MKESQLRVLIIDWNTVFAKQVRDVLQRLIPGLEADTANDPYVVERRFETREKYDLILVDIDASINPEHMEEVLNRVETPKIVWSISGLAGEQTGGLNGTLLKALRKPVGREQVKSVLTSEILPAVGVS